jgi:hypothetical protein
MTDNEITLNARVRTLETHFAEFRGAVDQQNKSIAWGNRMTIWQFISFTLVMAGTLFGTLAWISTSLREELRQSERNINVRFEQMEKRFDDRFIQMEKRFEDLRQVILKQQSPPRR